MALTGIFESCNIDKLERTELFQRIENKLKEDNMFKPLLDYLEESTTINRVYLVIGYCFFILATVFYQFGIQLICGAVGFLYPGYKTIECVEKFDIQQGKRWLKYWLVISAFYFLEILFFFLHWLPGYWVIKCAFFMWCYAPSSSNGSDVIYNISIRPFFKKNHGAIDDAVNHLVKTAHTICSDTNLDFNDVINTKSHCN